MSDQPKRTVSGRHEAVVSFRAKLASIVDKVLPEMEAVNEKLETIVEVEKRKSTRPPPDPRRESGDSRQDDEPPIDVVVLPDGIDPFPELNKEPRR
jgi:hypothetical protein